MTFTRLSFMSIYLKSISLQLKSKTKILYARYVFFSSFFYHTDLYVYRSNNIVNFLSNS